VELVALMVGSILLGMASMLLGIMLSETRACWTGGRWVID
jgi:ABC-type Mn2+/Zn2+ transport system permease subunit